ncbi:MAG: hypothetical protein OXI29_09425, partial [bacterium]|nr:hypothetical protein [bacterium]
KTFTVATTADALDEADETFLVELSGATGGAAIGTAEATGTITDDDARGVTVAGGPLSLDEADNPDTADAKENEADYTVVLDSEPTDDVTVTVASADTAIATVSTSSLTFTPDDWDEPQTVTVTAVADAIDNSGDSRAVTVTHTVKAGTSDYGGVSAASVAVTVADDDAAPGGITLTLSPAAVGEAAGKTSVTVTATVDGTTRYEAAQTVTVAVGGGTATETADYAAVTGFTITVPAGADSADGAFDFTPVDDKLHEGAETVEVTGSAGAVTVTKAALGITDDDTQPSFAVANASATEGGAITFTVTRSGATDDAVAVTWKTKPDGSGANPAATDDYTAQTAGQQLSFAKGDVTKTFTVATTADALDEADETFLVELSGATGGAAIGTAEATGTITDDDARGVTVAGGPVSLDEADNTDTADAKENEAAYTVVLDSEPTDDVTVTVASTDTAIATVSTSSLTFTPDNWNEPQTVTVTAVADAIDNTGGSRAVTVTHTVTAGTSDYGGVSADGVAVTVADDDDAPGGITLTLSPAAVGEAAGKTSVTVTATVDGTTRYEAAQTVTVAVGGGTATETADYAAVTGFTITVPAGADSADGAFDFTPVDDKLHEGAETVEVTGSAGAVTVTKAALGITDDDTQPSFAVANASATEGGAITFTVTRSGATDDAVAVTWKTKPDGSGANPAATDDYTAQTAGQQLSFAKGDVTKTFTVATTADALDEADETFLVELSGATGGAAIGTAEATGTITDDDARGVTVAGGP